MNSDVEWRKGVTDECLSYADGCITVPDKTGLGVKLNEEACLLHPYRPHTPRHYTGELTDVRPAQGAFYF